jgi:hypothetical protein
MRVTKVVIRRCWRGGSYTHRVHILVEMKQGESVEGLYCKKPIQYLASSEILTPPHPLSTQRVCPPPHTRQGVRGWGSIVQKTPDTALYSIFVSILWVSVSALSTGAYTATWYLMVNRVKGGWACTPPPPSPARANFSIMMACTPESGGCHSLCVLCGYTHTPHHISWRFPVRLCNDDLQILCPAFTFSLQF